MGLTSEWQASGLLRRQQQRAADYNDMGMIPTIIAISTVLSILSVASVTLRSYSRAKYASIGVEDWLALLSWPTGFIATVFTCHLTQAGVGKDSWNSNPKETSRAVIMALNIFLMSNLHIASMTLIKLSILIFYRRVFPFGGFRKACVFVGCFVAASGIGIIIANICHCEHVSDTITLPQNRKGQCIDTNPLYQSAAVILTIGDAFVLLLPFPEIFKSSMALNRKLHVIGVLLVGSLATISSVVRTYYTFDAPKLGPTNPTKIIGIMVFTAVIEVHLAIICACAPALKGLIRHLTTPHQSTHGSKSHRSPSGSQDPEMPGSRAGKYSISDPTYERKLSRGRTHSEGHVELPSWDTGSDSKLAAVRTTEDQRH